MNDKILCYLTPEADSTIEKLIHLGFDRDLAIAVLEQVWPEEDIYEIPGDDG